MTLEVAVRTNLSFRAELGMSCFDVSAATAALIMKANIVTLMPLFSFSLLSCTRNALSSVMSASS